MISTVSRTWSLDYLSVGLWWDLDGGELREQTRAIGSAWKVDMNIYWMVHPSN